MILSGILKKKYKGKETNYYPCPYIVGDILITTNEIEPSTRYPNTTWQKIEKETFLMCASDKYPVKTVSGENEHTLTIDEMPRHNHTIYCGSNGPVQASNYDKVIGGYGGTYQKGLSVSTAGNNLPHNNMPKFYSVYMWLRVA